MFNRAVDMGLLTINEVRACFGLSPVEGGDVLTVQTPFGVVAVSDLPRYFGR